MTGHKTIIGIIDKELLLEDLDDIPLDGIIGLSLSGKCTNMKQVGKLGAYGNKKYKLDLDLHKGTFNISENELPLCVESFNLKGREFIPIVILYCVHDKVKLNVLSSVLGADKEYAKPMQLGILANITNQ